MENVLGKEYYLSEPEIKRIKIKGYSVIEHKNYENCIDSEHYQSLIIK